MLNSDDFVPAFLEGNVQGMSNSILQLSSSSYTIGRAKPSEVNLPLIDVNISRKIHLHPRDVVILSEQNDKYNWTFNLGEPKRKSQDDEDAPPSKRPRLQPASKYDTQRRDEVRDW